MKKLILLCSAALLLAACSEKPVYHIHGYVTDAKLEGACVFLVPATEPVIEPTKENLDSTFIKDQKFEFEGTVERLVDIRIERLKRYGIQNLLVVTEPGDIYVTIGQTSSCYGTPQNDSVQVWKTLTEAHNLEVTAASQAGFREAADSIHNAYKDRTRSMAAALGYDSTLGSFLNGLYPAPDEEKAP